MYALSKAKLCVNDLCRLRIFLDTTHFLGLAVSIHDARQFRRGRYVSTGVASDVPDNPRHVNWTRRIMHLMIRGDKSSFDGKDLEGNGYKALLRSR